MYISFMLGNNDLKEYTETFFVMFERKTWLLLSGELDEVLIVGLSSFRIYRDTNDLLWLERGVKCKEQMKQWSEQGCPWNFEHKWLLLEAEGQYCCGNFEGAKESYKKAIESAQSHKFANDEALSCELAAYFYADIGDLGSSLEHIRLAHEKYHAWGAVAKAGMIFEYINQMFNGILGDSPVLLPSSPG